MVKRASYNDIVDAQPDELQLIEVLPAEEYERVHLPGAISIPLTMLDRDTAEERLDPGKPVVVYCWDAY
ncbi:hypothetical protein BH23CHL2_BH23CHL2_07520 [soil metagenome]